MKSRALIYCCTLMLSMQLLIVMGEIPKKLIDMNEKRGLQNNLNSFLDDFLYAQLYSPSRFMVTPLSQLYTRISNPSMWQNRDKSYWQLYNLEEIENDEPRARAIKRQVKYRQCYFNPVSCF